MKSRANANNTSPNPRRKKTLRSATAQPTAKPVLEHMSPQLRRTVPTLRGFKGVL